MGNNKSKPSCGECNCQSEVPRVISACNNAGEKGVSNTLEKTITGLLGKENSDFIMKKYSSAVGNQGSNSKWVSDYNKIKESYNNFEGFIEGNEECVRCDCVQAANEIIQDCVNAAKKVPSAISDLVNDETIRASMNKLASPIIDSAKGINTETNNDWKTIFYPNIKESFENNGLYQFSQDALQSRYDAFNSSTGWQRECGTNAYTTIDPFITTERNILDTFYSYYVAFLKDYETLYLHKETFSKTINNKLDELGKIQAKIDSYKKNLHIDNRKNLYQSNNYDFYINVRFYMLIVYYSIIIVYLIFSKFFSEKQYTNKILVLLLFIYLIIPIVLGYLINFAYEGYIYFLEYNNIKEDTKSYEDIINKNIM
jgi:hypothetical protein